MTCNLGVLAASASAGMSILVTPTALGTVTNTAPVTTTSTDPNPTNNTAFGVPDRPARGPVRPRRGRHGQRDLYGGGGHVTYTVTATNDGLATDRASITGNESDPDTANNRFCGGDRHAFGPRESLHVRHQPRQ